MGLVPTLSRCSRTRLSRTAKPCGPGAPTLALRSQRRLARALRVMVAKEPGHQGEHGVSRQTIAQGRPGDPAEPVVPAPCFFPHGGRGYQSIPGLPCALSLFRGSEVLAKLGQHGREDAGACLLGATTDGLGCLTIEAERTRSGFACRRAGRGSASSKHGCRRTQI